MSTVTLRRGASNGGELRVVLDRPETMNACDRAMAEELRAALEAAGVTHRINVYPGTQHAFHNDTGPRWNEEQALVAWNDTVAWFAVHV